MSVRLKLYRVEQEYLEYLSEQESKIPLNKANAKLRPFVGVVFTINQLDYIAPLSSQIHNKQTDFKVKIGEEQVATVRMAYMFPVPKDELVEIDFTEEYSKDKKYTALLINEAQYVNQFFEKIHEIAERTYLFNVSKKFNYDKFCCDFLLLERLANEYSKK